MRMDTKEHKAETTPAPEAEAELLRKGGHGEDPHPRAERQVSLEGVAVAHWMAGAGEQENAHC